MSKDPKYYRLPHGGEFYDETQVTTDHAVYSDAWRSLGEAVAKLFNGYELHGWDPQLHFHKGVIIDTPHGKRQRHIDSFVLSVEACRALLATQKKQPLFQQLEAIAQDLSANPGRANVVDAAHDCTMGLDKAYNEANEAIEAVGNWAVKLAKDYK